MASDVLYIGSNGHVAAIDPVTGREIWRTALGGGGLFSHPGHQDVCVLEHASRKGGHATCSE